MFVFSNNKSFVSQNVRVVGPLGGKFAFFSHLGFEIQSDFDYRTPKIKFYSVRALKCYLNDKNLIHGRVTATISKFSPQIYEMYFKNLKQNTGGPEHNFFLQNNNINLKCVSIELTCVYIHKH